MSEKITRAEYARRKGWSKPYVSKLVQTGKITLDDKNLLDPDVADNELIANSGPSADDVEQNKKGVTFNTARTMREVYAARLARLEYELKSGQVVPLEEVTRREFNAARVARDVLLNIPDRIAPVIAGETNVDKIHKQITAEIYTALEALSADAG